MTLKFVEKVVVPLQDSEDANVQNTAIGFIKELAKYGKLSSCIRLIIGTLYDIKDAMVLEASIIPILSVALSILKVEDWKLRQNTLNSITELIQYGWFFLSLSVFWRQVLILHI
jgi:hypothetical protein